MRESSLKPMVSSNLTKAIVLLFVALLFACGSSATATPQSDGESTSSTSASKATAIPATSAPSTGGSAAPTAIPTPAVQAT